MKLFAVLLLVGLAMADTGDSPPGGSGVWTVSGPTVIDTSHTIGAGVVIDADLEVTDGAVLTVDTSLSEWAVADGVSFTVSNGSSIVVSSASQSWKIQNSGSGALASFTVNDAVLDFGAPREDEIALEVEATTFTSHGSVFAYSADEDSDESAALLQVIATTVVVNGTHFKSSVPALSLEDCLDKLDNITCTGLVDIDSYPSSAAVIFQELVTGTFQGVKMPVGIFHIHELTPDTTTVTLDSCVFGKVVADTVLDLTLTDSYINQGVNVTNSGKSANDSPNSLLVDGCVFNDEICAALYMEPPVEGTIADSIFGDQLVAGRAAVDDDPDLDIVYLASNSYSACPIDFEYPSILIGGSIILLILILAISCYVVRQGM